MRSKKSFLEDLNDSMATGELKDLIYSRCDLDKISAIKHEILGIDKDHWGVITHDGKLKKIPATLKGVSEYIKTLKKAFRDVKDPKYKEVINYLIEASARCLSVQVIARQIGDSELYNNMSVELKNLCQGMSYCSSKGGGSLSFVVTDRKETEEILKDI